MNRWKFRDYNFLQPCLNKSICKFIKALYFTFILLTKFISTFGTFQWEDYSDANLPSSNYLQQQSQLITASNNIFHQNPHSTGSIQDFYSSDKGRDYLHPSIYRLLQQQAQLKGQSNSAANAFGSFMSSPSVPDTLPASGNDKSQLLPPFTAAQTPFTAFGRAREMLQARIGEQDLPVEWPSQTQAKAFAAPAYLNTAASGNYFNMAPMNAMPSPRFPVPENSENTPILNSFGSMAAGQFNSMIGSNFDGGGNSVLDTKSPFEPAGAYSQDMGGSDGNPEPFEQGQQPINPMMMPQNGNNENNCYPGMDCLTGGMEAVGFPNQQSFGSNYGVNNYGLSFQSGFNPFNSYGGSPSQGYNMYGQNGGLMQTNDGSYGIMGMSNYNNQQAQGQEEDNGSFEYGGGVGFNGQGQQQQQQGALQALGFNGAGIGNVVPGTGYSNMGNGMSMGGDYNGGMGMGDGSIMGGMEIGNQGIGPGMLNINELGLAGTNGGFNGDLDPTNMRRYSEYLNLINQKYGIGMPGRGAIGSNMATGERGKQMPQTHTPSPGNNAPDTSNQKLVTAEKFNGYGMAGNGQPNNGQMTSLGMTSNNKQTMASLSSAIGSSVTQNNNQLSSSNQQQQGFKVLSGNIDWSKGAAESGARGDTIVNAVYGTGQSPQFYRAGGAGSGEADKQAQMVYNVKQLPSLTGMSMSNLGGNLGEDNYQQQQMVAPSSFFSQQSTTSIQALTQQIRRLPAVFYVDSRNPDSRRTEVLLRETYGLPLVSFYVDKIDNPEQVERNLQQLTAHKGMPYLFICGTFIGSQDHIHNYHNNKQIPQLVEYVCGEKKGDSYGKRHRRKKKKMKPKNLIQ